MKLFLKNQIFIAIQSFLLTLVLFFIHKTILLNFLENETLIIDLYKTYIFHFILTTGIIFIVNYKKYRSNDTVFNTFIVFTILKMILVMVFLLPVFLSETKTKNIDVFNFFIPYFIYLSFEVYSITQSLQK